MAIRIEKEQPEPKRKAAPKIEPRKEETPQRKGETSSVEEGTSRRRGRPRIGEEHATLAVKQPWTGCFPPMSRRTWFRRQKEQRGA